MKWKAIIKVGLFGRVVETSPRRWRWLAKLEADFYCLCEMRQTEYRLVSFSSLA